MTRSPHPSPVPAPAPLAARIEAALLGQGQIAFRDDVSDQTKEDRRWIARRYNELKRTTSFTEAEMRSRREWLEGVLGEAMKTTATQE